MRCAPIRGQQNNLQSAAPVGESHIERPSKTPRMTKPHFAAFILVCAFANAGAQNFVPPTLEFFSNAQSPPISHPASPQLIVSTLYGISYQVNVNVAGHNIRSEERRVGKEGRSG